MIKFKLNNKDISIPSCWDDVTFGQYLKVMNLTDDTIELVSVFTGIEYETLNKSIIIGLDKVITALKFLNTTPAFPGSVNKCGKYDIPNNSKGGFNIQHETLGQFEDMRQIMKKIPQGDLLEHTKAYGRYVAIYLQKIRDGEYSNLKAVQMEDEINDMPAYQVIALGGFFFLRLWSLSTGIQSSSQNTPPIQKKSKPVTKGSKKASAHSRPSRKRR